MGPVSVTLYGKKRVFADVLKLRILKWGCHPGLSDGPEMQSFVSLKREAEGDCHYRREGRVKMEGRDLKVAASSLWPQAKALQQPAQLEGVRKGFSP